MVKKLFIIAAIALVGCNSEGVEIITEGEAEGDLFEKPEVVIEDGNVSLSKSEEGVIDAYEDFALTATCDLMPEESNFVYSPLSTTLALSLAANAAGENTYDELVAAMGLNGKDIDEINRLNYTLLQALPALNDDVEVSFANALFTSDVYDLLRPFKSRLTDAYDGRFFTLKSKQEAEQINAWVMEKTKGQISDLVEDTDFDEEKASFAFVNTCYLKAPWVSQFTTTEEKPFNLIDGSQINAQFLEELQLVKYANINGMEVVTLELGYESGFEVMFVLPNPSQTVSKALAEINSNGGFSAISKDMERDFVVLSLPKFKISEKIDFVDWLKQKGVIDLFDEYRAYLFKMALIPSYVTYVRQRCEFELDEKGVCGSAASVVGGFAGATGDDVEPEYREITLDRPFGFCVREASTSAILFMGQVVQP